MIGRPSRSAFALIVATAAISFATSPSVARSQDSATAPRSQATDSVAESLAPRSVTGRVVRPGQTGMINVARTWVTLHHVGPGNSGPVDSVRTDANGKYFMRYKPVGGGAVYFASSLYGGVAYFTAPLPPGDAGGDAGEITVFDTTSGPVPIHTRGRHLVVSASGVDGRRTLVEVFELSNDTTVTAIAGARNRATWSASIPPNATNFEVGQSDIGADAVQFRDGRVLAYASLSPGIRQVAFSYAVPASDFPLAIPMPDGVSVLEVLVEDSTATASGGGLTERAPVSLENRNFRRFLAQDVKSGATVTINVAQPTVSRRGQVVLVPVVTAAAIMALALAFALTRRRALGTVRVDESEDAAHLARDIADLDDAFERAESPSDAARDAYRQRRDALKARLTAALAKEEMPV